MVKDAFIFSQWETRVPYYALMKWDQERVLAAEKTWCTCRSKGIRTAFVVTFGGGWRAVAKEAGKQTLQYGGRKALGCITGIVCGYFGSAAIVLVTNSAKVVKIGKCCHSICSAGLDVAELCAAAPIHMVEIAIFGRPALLSNSEGFDIFCENQNS